MAPIPLALGSATVAADPAALVDGDGDDAAVRGLEGCGPREHELVLLLLAPPGAVLRHGAMDRLFEEVRAGPNEPGEARRVQALCSTFCEGCLTYAMVGSFGIVGVG